MRPPLLLTGGPAAGKSATARRVAAKFDRVAVIDVDDIRQLVVAGHAAPWEGQEGASQHRLGVRNACTLARQFQHGGFDVVLADVVTVETMALYHQLLPQVMVLRLQVSIVEARRRAGLRPAYLSEAEFTDLHAQQTETESLMDHVIDVDQLDLREQVDAVIALWPDR